MKKEQEPSTEKTITRQDIKSLWIGILFSLGIKYTSVYDGIKESIESLQE